MWGHWSPRGQSPAAAYEQMGWSCGLDVEELKVLSEESEVHAGDEGSGLKSFSEADDRGRAEEDEAGDG